LATAEAYDIPIILPFNKVDIINEEELLEVKNTLAAVYRDIGYNCGWYFQQLREKNVEKVSTNDR
jgi:ribosome biogenesis GTPase